MPANLRLDLFLLWKSSNASWDSRDLPQSPPPHEAWARCSMHTNSRIGRRNAHDTLSGRRIQASRLFSRRLSRLRGNFSGEPTTPSLHLIPAKVRVLGQHASCSMHSVSAGSPCFSSAHGASDRPREALKTKPTIAQPLIEEECHKAQQNGMWQTSVIVGGKVQASSRDCQMWHCSSERLEPLYI